MSLSFLEDVPKVFNEGKELGLKVIQERERRLMDEASISLRVAQHYQSGHVPPVQPLKAIYTTKKEYLQQKAEESWCVSR